MDFRLNDEQTMLAESVGTLLKRGAGEYGIIPPENNQGIWDALVEFGALDIGPESDRLGVIEMALIARALGEHLARVPYVDSVALRHALSRFTTLEAARETAALCLAEPEIGYRPSEPATTACPEGLTGEKRGVAFAGSVDLLVATASATSGVVLAMVPRHAEGMTITEEDSMDAGLGLATVSFDRVADVSTISGDEARRLVPALSAAAEVLVSAEAVGAAAALFALASDCAGQRRQFDQPLSNFQAIRHLLAEQYVKLETAWSSVLYAAATLDQVGEDGVVTSTAKAYATRATREVAESALQVLGGIAFTAEYPAHRFLRRIHARGGQFGAVIDHERRVADALRRRGLHRGAASRPALASSSAGGARG